MRSGRRLHRLAIPGCKGACLSLQRRGVLPHGDDRERWEPGARHAGTPPLAGPPIPPPGRLRVRLREQLGHGASHASELDSHALSISKIAEALMSTD